MLRGLLEFTRTQRCVERARGVVAAQSAIARAGQPSQTPTPVAHMKLTPIERTGGPSAVKPSLAPATAEE